MTTYTLDQADQGGSFEIHPGDLLEIHLAENPTTGFRWAVAAVNEQVLHAQGSTYTPTSGAGVGGSGERVFTFAATTAGVSPLAFKLWRDWLGDASITQRYQVTIVVRS
jgi:inhibitor of cysteine peptidase